MGTSLRPLHSSVASKRLHRVHGMQRMRLTEEQRETIEDIALSIFTDMANTGQSFQAALSAIYLSGLNHGGTEATTPDAKGERGKGEES